MTILRRLLARPATVRACGLRQGRRRSARTTPTRFHILAGSELKDVEAQVVAEARKIGVPVRFEYAGTLDIIDRVNRGEKVDAVWVANGAYTGLALQARPAASTKIMYSQIVLGVKPAVAARLGWDKTPPTWREIAAAAATGGFHYAMTNPTASNSGLSALVRGRLVDRRQGRRARASRTSTPPR